jgi:phage terminase large subunit-like protein
MAQAVRAFKEGIDSGQLTHNGDPDYVRHVGNAGRQETNLLDEEGNRIVILMKIRPEAKFDLCMAGVLSWQARLDALAAGAGPTETFIPYRIR